MGRHPPVALARRASLGAFVGVGDLTVSADASRRLLLFRSSSAAGVVASLLALGWGVCPGGLSSSCRAIRPRYSSRPKKETVADDW